MKVRTVLWAMAFVSLGCGQTPDKPNNGASNNGASNNGASNNGASNNGASNNGASNNGASNNGASNNGASNNGGSNNGASNNGASNNGTNPVFNQEVFYAPCGDPTQCQSEIPSCEFDEDCAVVPAGDVCGACVVDCPTGGVAVDDKAAYEAEFQALRDMSCGPPEACAADCFSVLPHCNLTTNQCAARQEAIVTTEGAPKSCEVAADCAAVFAGEKCDPCKCPNDAVRADFVDTYATAFDVECASNAQCRCANVDVDCVATECVVVR